jgi:hypothetical protein
MASSEWASLGAAPEKIEEPLFGIRHPACRLTALYKPDYAAGLSNFDVHSLISFPDAIWR